MSELAWKNVAAHNRIYMFPDSNMTVANVVEIFESSTEHGLKTADGRRYVIPSGWRAIEIVENLGPSQSNGRVE